MSESIQSNVHNGSRSQASDTVDEKAIEANDVAQNEQQSEPVTQIHTTTFLALSAICLTYFAQSIALVGTGSVSSTLKRPPRIDVSLY